MPIEKVWLPEEARVTKQADGTEKTEIVKPWEIQATGKEVNELRGVFKNVKDDMLHQGMKDWADGGGDLKISRPDGSVDTIRADKEHLYRQQPGFCVTATRPTFLLDVPWDGSAKREGIRRQILKRDYVETWYNDGRHVVQER